MIEELVLIDSGLERVFRGYVTLAEIAEWYSWALPDADHLKHDISYTYARWVPAHHGDWALDFHCPCGPGRGAFKVTVIGGLYEHYHKQATDSQIVHRISRS